ncbi:MAG: N-acetylmuramoyl-L-alanine amidase [Lachnospiraceae bacterium]|nr:N-acetylmuramoyl-L-alanine amidase [Lachnospiraceae bacterium]
MKKAKIAYNYVKFLSLFLFSAIIMLIPFETKASGITVYNGIDYSSVYDFNYYVSRYPDIAYYFGNDPQGALAHFVTFGISEGRQGCENSEPMTPAAGQGLLSGFTVILDAGHGGRDPGCVRNGVCEKNVNLSIVMKIKEMLEAQGATVLLTRPDDTFVSLEYRYCFENIHPEAVFVSIHCNALAGNSSISGMSAYCYTPGNEKSFDLAACVYSGAVYATGAKDRGIKTLSDIKVVYYSTIPSVLIETGYLSSSAEFPLLTSPDYQDTIATGITNGILTYKLLNAS